MDNVTMLWSGIAAAAMLLGLVHLVVWLKDRRQYASLALAVVSVSLAGISYCELGMMTAQTPHEWGQWVRWCHIPLFVHIVSTLLFVRLYLGTGSVWLASLIVVLRSVIFVMNFGSGPNFNFSSVEALDHISFLGEQVAVVSRATVSPWQWIATLSVTLNIFFFLQAGVMLWLRGSADDRRKAVMIGGALFFFTLLSGVFTQMVIWTGVTLPMLITPPFLLSLAAMVTELGRDTLQAGRLADDLRESRNRLEQAANAAGLGLGGWHVESGRLWVSHHFRELVGMTEEEIGVEKLASRIHVDDLPRLRSTLKSCVEVRSPFDIEFRVCLPGKEVRWLSLRGNADSLCKGRDPMIRGVIRDVSDRKRAEDQAQELRQELTHAGRVTMLGQLASALAHELSQPLGAILRNAEVAALMLDRPGPDLLELREIIADIHRDNRRAADVIERLRSLLKRKQMHVQPLAVAALVEDASTLVRADAAARHVTVACEMKESLPMVSGDRVHLAQVLINLLINGMDAAEGSSDPGRRVLVAARRSDRDTVEIAVTDSGAGIADSVLPRLFEPFFTTKAEGMGMGLAVSRTIVEAHGGRLWAENEPAGGAVFRLTLPIFNGAVA